jgi:hypothetical protein
MIESFIDGRVRIRSAALRDPGTLAMVEGLIKAQEGILEVTGNPRTGSLLVCYDPDVIPRENLLAAAAMLREHLGESPDAALTEESGEAEETCACTPLVASRPLLSRSTEVALLAGLFGVTLAGILTEDKRLHVVGGALFAALTAVHIYRRRRCF